MELLVVTLAQANPARDGEALARMRVISDTVRNAPGLNNARFYRSREPGSAYFFLTTWENAEWWQKAQERHSPYRLLQTSPAGIFPTPPEQWLMRYLWGYSRPQAAAAVATAHLASVRPEQSAHVQQIWLESLQRQAIEPILSFALLACSEYTLGDGGHQQYQYPIFLNLLSWPGESYRDDFYAQESNRHLQGLLNSVGRSYTLKLDPI
jgi:hypothetical protein